MRFYYVFTVCFLFFCFSCKEKSKTLLKHKSTSTEITFNYDAAYAYYRLTDSVKKKNKITNLDWKTFLNVNGNRLYIEENNIPKSYLDGIRQAIEIVYSQKHDSLISTPPNEMLLQIRKKYEEGTSLFHNHLEFIKTNSNMLLDSIRIRTAEFLPDGSFEENKIPTIYYHTLDHDGSANNSGIFISLLASYDFNLIKTGIFEAHELHHIMRHNIFDKLLEISKNDKGILYVLEACLNEGLADLIDKREMLSETSNWWLKPMLKDAYINQAQSVIENLNNAFLDEINGNHKTEASYRNIILGSVGHIPGYFMANTILENGVIDNTITNAANPFQFFIVYNEVAEQKLGHPKFDKEVIEYLKLLEAKYLKNIE